MLTVGELKVGQRFLRYDKTICLLIERNNGHAIIALENPPKKTKKFTTKDKKIVEFVASAQQRIMVSLGLEVLEVLD